MHPPKKSMDADTQRKGLAMKELYERIDTYGLELAYEKALSATANILCHEERRDLRVQLLLVEAEKNELRDRIDLDGNRLEVLENGNLRKHNELEFKSQRLVKADSDVQAFLRKNDALKGEIKSANCKSAELLAEKVTLDREVASLKSEVQNLKSQAVSHLIEVAEKSALERNLSSLQQELDLLKRSTQLTQAAQKKSQVEDEISQNKLKSLQAELEEERSQRLRTEELFQKASTDWESKKTTFELRSNTFRNKLRVTMEQLKACQAELHEFHTSGGPEPRLTPVRPGRKGFAKKSLKLSSIQKQDADSMIGTPGEMPAAKKVKRVLTLPGDKSTFSITPYLNRASSVVVESPHSETGHINVSRQKQNSFDHLDDHGEANDNAVFTRPPAPLAQPKSHVIGPRAKPSKNVSSMRIRRISPSLEDVSELAENDEIDPLLDEKSTRTIAEAPKQSNDHLLLADPIRKSAEIQKRKRKVLGGRLHEPMLDDSRNKGLEGDQTRGFREACPAQLSLTSRRTFGAISPLKSKMRPMLDAVA